MARDAIPGKRIDAMENHARLLDAARALLLERGLDLEVTDVAERAGVGVGTLYRHFANRDELVRATLVRLFDDVLARVRTAAEVTDPTVALRQIPQVLIADPALFTVFHDPRSSKILREVKKTARPMAEEAVHTIAGIVERGMRTGAFRAELDPPATAAAILGSIGLVIEAQGSRRPLAELAALLADLHYHMVAAR